MIFDGQHQVERDQVDAAGVEPDLQGLRGVIFDLFGEGKGSEPPKWGSRSPQ